MLRSPATPARQAAARHGLAIAGLLAAVCLPAVLAPAAARAAVTYRSATVTCRDATLYGNLSRAGRPSDRVGTVVRGQVVGYEGTRGRFAVVRTGAESTIGVVSRPCVTVPVAGSSGSFLWPARMTCREASRYGNYSPRTKRPLTRSGTLRRGRQVGYQYFRDPENPTGAWAIVRTGAGDSVQFGYVLRSCLRVAPWAPGASWNPAR